MIKWYWHRVREGKCKQDLRHLVHTSLLVCQTCTSVNHWLRKMYHTVDEEFDWTRLTWAHWGRVTHICVSILTIIGWDNGLSPGRRQAIIWTNVGILLIGPLGKKINEISIEINTFSLKKIHLKMSSGIWRPFSSRPQQTWSLPPYANTIRLDLDNSIPASDTVYEPTSVVISLWVLGKCGIIHSHKKIMGFI